MSHPIHVEGSWRHGWALDVHTTASVFLGHDAQGRAEFDTTRSPLGEFVYQLKYAGRAEAAIPIADAMAAFLAQRPGMVARIDVIVPVPPSVARAVQPVTQIAEQLAVRLNKTCAEAAVVKTKPTPMLKSVQEIEERREVLAGAFEGDRVQVEGRGVLLVDDLYRSGATANAVTLALIRAGAERVYFLAATRTRSLA